MKIKMENLVKELDLVKKLSLVKELSSPMKERVKKLLRRPYQGSKCYEHNHNQARFDSNCHGTMAFVFDLQDPMIKTKTDPIAIASDQMEELISKYFLISDKFQVENLVSFYTGALGSNEERLIHTALLIGQGDRIFHQSGYGGVFEITTLESKSNKFRRDCPDLRMNVYRKS